MTTNVAQCNAVESFRLMSAETGRKSSRGKMATYHPTMASQSTSKKRREKTMEKGYISKSEFIRAYQWTYGTTKTEAGYIWSIASYDYKVEIIRGYTDTCKKSFYHD